MRIDRLLPLLCVVAAPGLAASAEAGLPNVVLIISDDQGWTDYGFMGHETIRTPSLDRLAGESALFTRGYVPSSLCRPSLATLATGLFPHQHRISGNDPAGHRRSGGKQLRERLIANIDRVPTLPRLLAEKGYLSHQSGKWWEGDFRRGGFTHGMTRGFPNPGGRHGDDGLKIGRQGMQPIFDFIDEARQRNKPFFLWYAPVSSVDLVPTILAACGLKPTADMQGLDLLELLRGRGPRRDTIFGETFAHDVADVDDPAKSLQYRWAIEGGRWKLIVPAAGQGSQLYDLSADPHESKDLARAHPDVVERLAEKLDAWWKPGKPPAP